MVFQLLSFHFYFHFLHDKWWNNSDNWASPFLYCPTGMWLKFMITVYRKHSWMCTVDQYIFRIWIFSHMSTGTRHKWFEFQYCTLSDGTHGINGKVYKPSTIVSDGELKLSLYEKPAIGLRFWDLLKNGSHIEFRNSTLTFNSK